MVPAARLVWMVVVAVGTADFHLLGTIGRPCSPHPDSITAAAAHVVGVGHVIVTASTIAPRRYAAAKAAGRRTTRAAAASASAASASTATPTAHFDPRDIVGKKISKYFAGSGYCIGEIIEYREDPEYKHLYSIKYSDGDNEDVTRPVALKLITRYNTTHAAEEQ